MAPAETQPTSTAPPPASLGRVLIVEDEDDIRDLEVLTFTREGYAVDAVGDGRAAVAACDPPPDLVILDLGLPGMSGLDVLREIRKKGEVPVIVVSARGEEPDRVLGLELGADDYLMKPFSPRELVARARSVLRRSHSVPGNAVLEFDTLTIDTDAREVRLAGTEVELTPKEYDLLAFLAGTPRRAFSRAELLESVWGSSRDWQGEATVTEHVRRVRLKIEADPEHPHWIKTVRGVGYRFEP